MRASIIIAARNEGERLEKTVRSCLESTADSDLEIIVADDASTDGSTKRAADLYPRVKVAVHPRRAGVAKTRCTGARAARGDVLIFLDGHCKPETGALARLVADVEETEGRAIMLPRIAVLDASDWSNHLRDGVGHGFHLDLETLARSWISPRDMRSHVGPAATRLYECPAPMGCCLALDRRLYDRLGGFDEGMRGWGSEDLDLGLQAWLMGFRVLHDPVPVVGHWFRPGDANPAARAVILTNELRLARRLLGDVTWVDWVERARGRHPADVWRKAWRRFSLGRNDLEQNRAECLEKRAHDEFWYAEHFGLNWPRWLAGREPEPGWGEEMPTEPELLRQKYIDHPRNCGPLSDAHASASVAESNLGRVTIWLKIHRSETGTLFIERATVDGEGATELLACGRWLAHRIEGEPLAKVRGLESAELCRALRAEPRSADLAIRALRRAVESI